MCLSSIVRTSRLAFLTALIAGGLPILLAPQPVAATPVADCTPTTGYSFCKRFSYTGAPESITLPTYVNVGANIDIQVWGAGGAGTFYPGWTGDLGGGAGGYVRASVRVLTVGETFSVEVGTGGQYRNNTTTAVGGGGAGGLSTLRVGGQGGGYSGVFVGSGRTTPLLIAGGGGGSSPGHTSSGIAGGGGAMGAGNTGAGQSGNWTMSGAGGTATAGGAAATTAYTGQFSGSCPSPALPGSKFQGGRGCGTSAVDTEGGGGGGGGFFGGGGGRDQRNLNNDPQNGGGGGGSGYSDTTRMTVVTATTGGNGLKDNLPGGRTSNALYIAGIGKGGTGSGTARTASVAGTADGGHGMVIIQWGDPPTARPDSATGAASTAIVTAVATNDSTPAGSGRTLVPTSVRLCATGESFPNCTATTKTVPGEGTYTVNSTTGEVTFISVAGYVGTGTQTYVISDSLGLKGASSVSFTVLGPTTQPDTATGSSGTPISVNPATNDTAPAGRTLTPSSVRLCATGETAPTCTATSKTVPGEGTYTVNPTTGVVSFTSVAGFAGTSTQTYVIADSAGARASNSVSFTTTVPPKANADSVSGGVGLPISLNPLSNDLASAGATLVASSVKLCGVSETAPNCTLTSRTIAGEGTYTVNPTTGVVTFTGVAGFVGTSTLDYVVTDSSGQKASSEVSFTTVAPPVLRPDQVAGPKDEVLTLNLLANDSPSSPATLVGSSVKLCGVSPVETAPSCTKTSITVAGEGTYTVNPTTGVVTFTGIGPSYTYSGTRVFDYVVSDSFGQTSSSTATFIALPPPATRAVLDSLSVAYNTNASFSGANAPLVNDSAGTIPAAYTTPGTVALDTSSLKLCGATESQITGGGASTGCTETSITVPGEGIWSLNSSTGEVTFDPLASFYGVATPVPYAVCNTVSGSWQPATPTATCAAATLNVTVAAPPAPSGVADSTTVPFGQSATLTPLGNDTATGASADSLKLCSVSPAETAPNCFSTVVTVPNEGTWTLNPSTGVVTFVPLASFAGVATPVSYVGADVVGQVFSSVLNATITPPASPTASPDSGTALLNAQITLTPISNDSGTGLKANSILLCSTSETAPNCTRTSLTIAGKGSFSVNPTSGDVLFTPVAGFSGTVDPIPYTVSDVLNRKASSTLTVSIAPPPVARPDSVSGGVGLPISLNPLSNDLASAGATLVASSVKLCGVSETAPNCTLTSRTIAGEGTYTVNPTTGVVTFTGVAGFVGTSTLDYVVTDSSGQKASSEVSFTTVAPPVLRPDQVAGPKDEVLTLNLLANDSPSSPATLVGSSVKLCGVSPVETAPSCTKTSITVAGEGTYTVNPTTGVVTFTGIGPSYTYSGTRVFDYVVSDSFGQTSSSTATFIALPPPATRAVLDSLSVAYNTNASFSGANAPLVNDSAGTIPAAYTTPGTVALDTSSLKLCGATESQITGGGASTGCTETSITVPGEGIWSLNSSTGEVTFDPLASFYGVATPVPYAVCNTVSGSWQPATPTATCAAATLNVTVAAPPAPSGVADSTTVPFGQSATLTPLGNDTATGASADSLKLCSVSPAETAPNCFSTVVTVPNEGTWTLNPSTGVVTFVPLASFAGVATPVSYVGADVVGQVFSSVLNATITPPASPAPSPAPAAPVVPVATVPAPVTPVMPLPSNPVVPVTTSPPLDVVKPSATKAKKPTLPATGASGLLAMGLLGLGLLFIGIETKRRNRLRNL